MFAFKGLCPYPNCDNIPNVYIRNRKIVIDCVCGYRNMTIKDYLITANNKQIRISFPDTEITNQISKGFTHLNEYFTQLKNHYINKLTNQINELESSYEISYNINKDILSLLQTLIKNYKCRNSIINSIQELNFYTCENSATIEDVINYLKTYDITEKKIIKKEIDLFNQDILLDLSEIKSKKEDYDKIDTLLDILDNSKRTKQLVLTNDVFTKKRKINSHSKEVNSLLLLQDNRIASCSEDNTIRIFNPSKWYKCEQIIENTSPVISICQMDNGTIVSAIDNDSNCIRIGEHIWIGIHDELINKIITLSNNRIASCSGDKTIKIMMKNPNNRALIIIKSLIGHREPVISLLYIKEKEMLISGSTDGLLIWDMKTYELKSCIKGVSCTFRNALYQFDNNRVLVGSERKFYIVNIDKFVIERVVGCRKYGFVNCFIKMRDNMILCGCDKGKFLLYNMETNQNKMIRKSIIGDINDLLKIDCGTFISCSTDKSINVWSFKYKVILS